MWEFLKKASRVKVECWGQTPQGETVEWFVFLFISLFWRVFLGAPDVKVWASELRCTSCEHSSSSHVAMCGCRAAKCSMEAAVSGPAASQWSHAFDSARAAKQPHSYRPSLSCKSSFIHFYYSFILFSCCGFVCFWFHERWKKGMWIFLVFQVSYIYSLAVFEDYLYAIHSDPSKGSSSAELLQIHRFNITADSRTLASLGNSKGLRVYHKLTQPKGKGQFLHICKYLLFSVIYLSKIQAKVLTFLFLISFTVRSHACEMDSYGKPGGCSHICLLSGSYKSRTCRCRTGYSLGFDGMSCKS